MRVSLVLYYPTDSQLQVYAISTREGYFRLPTLRRGHLDLDLASQSIMEQMIASWSMVMVHALMAAGQVFANRRSWAGDQRPAPSVFGSRSNVVHDKATYLARPITKAPETQIYFITHRSGAFRCPARVVRGERASRSIVNSLTALWSIWMVASLISRVWFCLVLQRGVAKWRSAAGGKMGS